MRKIDADAMLARLEEWNTSDSTDKALYNFTMHRILEQPTIEPERKKGKWIPQDFNNHSGMTSTAVYYYPKCSVCGNNANYTNFCPVCGADMRGDNDDQSK